MAGTLGLPTGVHPAGPTLNLSFSSPFFFDFFRNNGKNENESESDKENERARDCRRGVPLTRHLEVEDLAVDHLALALLVALLHFLFHAHLHVCVRRQALRRGQLRLLCGENEMSNNQRQTGLRSRPSVKGTTAVVDVADGDIELIVKKPGLRA